MRLNTLGGLWIERTEREERPAVRPRRLALLAVLAAAGARGTTRERVLAILWPESPPDRARHALSQTLYSLRQDLAEEVVIATASELRLDPARITTDVDELRAALAAREWARAASLYTGPFLEGFYLAGAPEFERWSEEERVALERECIVAIERAARAADAEHRAADAATAWERLTRLDPLEGRFAAGYMEALLSLGRRGEALAHGTEHSDRVRAELDASPDDRVLQLMRDAGGRSPRGPIATPASGADVSVALEASAVVDTAPSAVAARPTPPPRGRRWQLAAIALVGGIGVALAVFLLDRGGETGDADEPTIAVGRVQDLVTPDSAQLGGVLSEMLATSLGRLTNVNVVANSRILELIPRRADTARSWRNDAARRAGATELLEGELMPMSDRRLHLALRRVDLGRGIVLGVYQVTGTDRLALVDSVTLLIAEDLEADAPAGSIGDVATTSPLAYRLYEEGLRAFHQFDRYAANRLFHSAITEDSSFAMATYYAWRSEVAIGGPRQSALAERASALAGRASPRDRLLIRAHVGYARSDLGAIAAADTLARRYSSDPEALLRAAEVTSDFTRASRLLERAIVLDSAASMDEAAICRACQALDALALRLAALDSVEGAERTYRRWAQLRPSDPAPWEGLADHLIGVGRFTDAAAAQRRADSLGASPAGEEQRRLARALRSDDLSTARAICERQLVDAPAAELPSYVRLCVVALRMEGRYREALALLRGGRVPGTALARREARSDPLHQAVLDLEMRRPRLAAAEFRRLAQRARADPTLPRGVASGQVAWFLTLEATATLSGGDTVEVRALIDTIAAAGVPSLNPRDRLLHHYVRGALLARAGEHEAAVRELRAAMHAPTRGYSRINLELARSLATLGRAREAIPVLRAVLHGGIDGDQIALTRTEVHAELGRLFAEAGMPDSAAHHLRIVERSWQQADDFLRPAREVALRPLSDRRPRQQ